MDKQYEILSSWQNYVPLHSLKTKVMKREDIIEVLGAVRYPETGRTLEEEGMIGEIETNGNEINVTLLFQRLPTLSFRQSDVMQRMPWKHSLEMFL